MYIPLDNLYDWISGNIPDTLIYRFYPPGEKNLSNLISLDRRVSNLSLKTLFTNVPVICHDQEPLQYNLYQLPWKELRDTCYQGHPHNKDFEFLYNNQAWWEWLTNRNIASVINLTINDRAVLLHSEQNSPELGKFENVAVGAYWWSHGMIARDWYRFAYHDVQLTRSSNHQFTKDFNIYSRAWQGTREYRLFFLSKIVEQQLEKTSRITFSHCDQVHYSNHTFVNKEFDQLQDISLLPNFDISSHASATYDVGHYNECAIDVVLETLFDDTRWHLTEKILRPIACGKPFMLAATAGSLKYLRNYGFKTFVDVIDESYDDIKNPAQRIQAIVDEMSRISNLDAITKHNVYQAMHKIAQYNQQHFFSNKFSQQLVDELAHNLNSAVLEIKKYYQTGRTWAQQRRLMTHNQRELMMQYGSQFHPTWKHEVAEILQECRQSKKL